MATKDFRGVGLGYDIALYPPVPDAKIVRYFSNGSKYFCVWETIRSKSPLYLCTTYEPGECYRLLHLETRNKEVAEFWLLNETEGRAR